MKSAFRLILVAMLALSGCGSNALRYSVTTPVVDDKIAIAYRSVEVREVSLPSYAESDEIHRKDPTGALRSSADVLWSDAPKRSIALELSGNLAKLTRARVASEPWPFESFPEARVDLRLQDLVAGEDNIYRATGQYFVSNDIGRQERTAFFDLAVPFDGAGGPAALAQARGRLILDLARLIARDGLR